MKEQTIQAKPPPDAAAQTDWSQELVEQYGHLPIWTVTWHEYYVPFVRHRQTFAEGERLAREHAGQIVLLVRQFGSTKLE